MIEDILRFGAKLEIDSFGDEKSLYQRQIDIPVARSAESISLGHRVRQEAVFTRKNVPTLGTKLFLSDFHNCPIGLFGAI